MLKMTLNETPRFVLEQCQELFFRQSFLYDYYTCPKMAYYHWVEESSTEAGGFLAATLGTAGHEVIFQMHEERNWQLDSAQLMDRFEAAFYKELNASSVAPELGKYNSIAEALAEKMPSYLDMLDGYQQHPHNHEFNSTMHEQAFVLEVSPVKPGERPYIFTGTIDQAGIYDDGTFALRDIKFRANDFRPSAYQFHLDIQMTIYAAALLAGNPACTACRPQYAVDPVTLERKLHYEGPCDQCKSLIGTPKWPRKFPAVCELIWMQDFKRYKEDKVKDKYIPDNTKPKIANPKGRGPKVYPKMLNPAWVNGPKAGDYKGPCYIKTYRDPARLKALMEDILVTCNGIRQAEFYRRPGSHCSFWCKYQESCTQNLKTKVEATQLSQAALFTSKDPFA